MIQEYVGHHESDVLHYTSGRAADYTFLGV